MTHSLLGSQVLKKKKKRKNKKKLENNANTRKRGTNGQR
jgi:hypothetical protein